MAAVPAPSWHEPPAVLGRERESAALVSFLEGAARQGGAQLVTGAAGIGKSALLDGLAEVAASTGARVLRAAGSQFETEIGCAGLNQLLLPHAADLPGLPAVQRRALDAALGLAHGEPPGRLVLAGAVLAVLRHLSGDAPVVLVIDDLQWMDRASTAVLSLVARRLPGHRVGLLLAQRTGDESFFDRSCVPELPLEPLDDDTSLRVLHRHHPELHPSVRRRILAEASGNPLALIELPRALNAEQGAGADVLPPVLPLGDRLRQVFASRIAGLPAPTRRLLLLAALGGGDTTRLMDVVTRSAADLAPAESSGLVRLGRRDNQLHFAHPLARSAVVGLATPAERRAAHRRLAELTDDDALRTLHLAESAVGADDRVAAMLSAVGDTALDRGDPVQAVSLLLRSAELGTDPAEQARRLARAAYIGANVTGTLAGSRAVLERARAADPAVVGTLQAATAAAAQLINSEGDVDTTHGMLLGALRTTDPDPRGVPGLEDALQTLLTVCTFGGREDLWRSFSELVTRFAPLLSAPFRLAAATFADPLRATAAQLAELDARIAAVDRGTRPIRVLVLALAGHYVDRVPTDALQRIRAEGLAGSGIPVCVQAMIMLAVPAFFEGRWDEATALADEAITMCEENGYQTLLCGSMNPRMLLAAARGDAVYLDRARARQLHWALPRKALAIRTFTANVDGLAALTRGRYLEAYEHYTSICPLGTFPPYGQVTAWTVLDAVEAAELSGHREAARRHVRAAVDAGVADVSPRLRFLCGAASALVADADTYPDRFEPLVRDPASTRWPFWLARVELAYGQRLRLDRAMRAARPHLERARDIFDGLDALPWTERAAAALRATGATRPRAAHGRGSALTPQELQIAQLAAGGLTNRQIGERLLLSPRTVGAHLYRVFPKLGITSRAALRDALTGREAR